MTVHILLCIMILLYKILHYISSTIHEIHCMVCSEGRETKVAEVKLGKNESLDNALRRFKRSCQRSGVLSELRKREFYDKPSVKRKKKAEAAKKKKKF